MKFYHLIFLIIFFVCCASCSDRNSNSGINIFRPDASKIEQYNRSKGSRPEVSKMSKSMRNLEYENDNESFFGYFTFVIGIIALIILAVLFERYLMYRVKLTADSPAALFVELCAAHQLTRMERHLIERVAEVADISDPLPVFMEPKYLTDAMENENFQDVKQIIEYLSIKLFESKLDSSILKRSSILLQSEQDSDSKNGTKSDINSDSNITHSTITYETSQINNNQTNKQQEIKSSEQSTIIKENF
jgi:hypothetical protein